MHIKPLGWFPNKLSASLWLLVFVSLVPLTSYVRFSKLDAVLFPDHPVRQYQTALTTHFLQTGQASVFNYQSPLNGRLWRFVREFPTYQWTVARLIDLGLPLELASRVVTLTAFFICLALLVWFVKRFWNAHAAAWVGLIFATSPYILVNSRMGLIDFMALAFTLGYLSIFLVCREAKSVKTTQISLFFCLGVLAGVTKITVWFVPTVFIGILLLHDLFKDRHPYLPKWIFAFALQGAIAMAWILYANTIFSPVAGAKNPMDGFESSWILGDLAKRLDGAHWLLVTRSLVRNVLSDWIAVLVFCLPLPFLRMRGWAWLLFLGVAPPLIFFNVFPHHDYYGLTCAPFLMVGAGLVLSKLLENKSKWNTAILFAVALVFLNHVRSVKYQYEGQLANYDEFLRIPKNLKALTDPSDLLYVEEGDQHWWITLYSDRLISLGPWEKTADLPFTGYWFQPGLENFDGLLQKQKLYVQSLANGFHLIRSEPRGAFTFNARQDIALFQQKEGKFPDLRAGETIDACAGGQTVYRVPRDLAALELTLEESKTRYVLPPLPLIQLPQQSPLGCRFHIELKEKNPAHTA